MTKISDNANPTSIIQWLDDMSNLINKHGFTKLVKSLISLIVTVLTFYFIFNFDKVIDWVTEYLNTRHQQAIEYRIEIGPQIDNILNSVIDDLGASRAFVFEPHNGKSNINGLPFGYVRMTYEQTAHDVYSVMGDYDNDIDVNQFPFINEVYKNYVWAGTMADLQIVDERIYRKMHSNYADYLCIVTVHGATSPVGFVGVTYVEGEEKANTVRIERVLNNAAQRIGNLLEGYGKKKPR